MALSTINLNGKITGGISDHQLGKVADVTVSVYNPLQKKKVDVVYKALFIANNLQHDWIQKNLAHVTNGANASLIATHLGGQNVVVDIGNAATCNVYHHQTALSLKNGGSAGLTDSFGGTASVATPEVGDLDVPF